MIAGLDEARRAGVKIKFLVRGICCLAPAVEGQSKNIPVTRIVDGYLEHALVFVFTMTGNRSISWAVPTG